MRRATACVRGGKSNQRRENSSRSRGIRSSPVRRSRNWVKKVKWLIPEAVASTSARRTRIRRASRLMPRGISWHMPTLRTLVARLMARVTRLIGFVRLMSSVSGQYRSMWAQMPRVLWMLRREWNTAPGPPFSPLICRAPWRFGTS